MTCDRQTAIRIFGASLVHLAAVLPLTASPRSDLCAQLPKDPRCLRILTRYVGARSEAEDYVPYRLLSPNGQRYAYVKSGEANGGQLLVTGSFEPREEETIHGGTDLGDAGEYWLSWPDWSADNRTLTYAVNTRAREHPTTSVILHDTRTARATEILRETGVVHTIRFSSDGTRLAFLLNQAGSTVRCKVYDIAGEEVVYSSPAYRVSHDVHAAPSWADTANEGSFVTDTHALCFNVDEGRSKRLRPASTYGSRRALVQHVSQGRRIAYAFPLGHPRGVFVYDLNTQQGALVIRGSPVALAWSPDGRFLLAMLWGPSSRRIDRLLPAISGGHWARFVHEVWGFDTRSGKTFKLKLTDRVREALLRWQR